MARKQAASVDTCKLAQAVPVFVFAVLLVAKQVWIVHVLNTYIGPWLIPISVVTALMIGSWVAVLPSRWQWAGFWAIDFLVSALIFVDQVYFRGFGEVPSAARLNDLRDLLDVSALASAAIHPVDLWLFVDLPVIAIAFFIFRSRLRLFRLPIRWMLLWSCGCLGATLLMTAVDADHKFAWKGSYASFRTLGPLVHHSRDIGSYLSNRFFLKAPTAGEIQEARAEFIGERARSRPPPSSLFGVARNMNIIILQVESLQSYPFKMKFKGRDVLPNMDRLARESLWFEDFYSEVGHGATADADLLVNCSIHPLLNEVVYSSYADRTFHCMPAIMKEHGYRTFALQGVRPDFWNVGTMYSRIGFDRFFSANDFDASERIGLGMSDASFLSQAAGRLQSLPEPFYAFMLTISSHAPFAGFVKGPDGARVNSELGRYLNALHYTDQAIGEFIQIPPTIRYSRSEVFL